MGIKDRQQGQADAGLRGRGGDPFRHLGEVGVRPSVEIVVEIVELADARKAGFQHLHIKLRGYGLDLPGRHRQSEAVHHLAPAPEAVRAGAARFGKASHAALEGVAVQIGHAGNEEGVALVAGQEIRLRRQRRDPAFFDRQAHVRMPAVRQ